VIVYECTRIRFARAYPEINAVLTVDFIERAKHKAPTSTLEAFNEALDKWIFIYNNKRPHGGINYQTPMEKLEERYHFLDNYCFLDKVAEEMKIKFLKSEPKNIISWSKIRKEKKKK
jgi:hypothetical protein